MHVLHVIDSVEAGGGAEESLVVMLPLLRDRGIDGSVVCLYGRGGYEDHLRSLGFDVTVLDGSGPLDSVMPLRQEILSRNPDLVHATLIDATFATRAACLGLGVPQLNSLVSTTYDPVRVKAIGVRPWKIKVVELVDRASSRWVDKFHVVADAVGDEARSVLKIPNEKLAVVPRGRDRAKLGEHSLERRVGVRGSLGIGLDTPVILNVARQVAAKAQVDLVQAMPQVVAKVPGALLLIAGQEGPSTDALRSAIKTSPVRDHIRVLGHRSDVADLLAAADLFVLPSLFEGSPGSLIEAMAMECPIIGSDAPAVAEVLGWGMYGRVVQRGDVGALGTAMADLLTHPAERQRYAEAGLHRFNERYELSNVADAMAAMYRDVVSASHPRSRTRIRARRRPASHEGT